MGPFKRQCFSNEASYISTLHTEKFTVKEQNWTVDANIKWRIRINLSQDTYKSIQKCGEQVDHQELLILEAA